VSALEFPRAIAEHFVDTVVDEVSAGTRALTAEEREFLTTTTPYFEECSEKEGDLRQLCDRDLMQRCYEIWADYASTQI
jgi:hypothetical protein